MLSNAAVHTDAYQSIGMATALCKGHEGSAKWVKSDTSSDARMRPISLTESGRRKLESA
jgi:hypothetical protein